MWKGLHERTLMILDIRRCRPYHNRESALVVLRHERRAQRQIAPSPTGTAMGVGAP